MPYNVGLTAMHYADEFVILDEPFTVELFAWTIRKNDPDFPRWLKQLLEGIEADGRYEKIHDKWSKSRGWFKFVRQRRSSRLESRVCAYRIRTRPIESNHG